MEVIPGEACFPTFQSLERPLPRFGAGFRFSKLSQVLWDRNPEFLKSEIGPFSDFKEKSYLMGLKSAHSQESDFQERSGSYKMVFVLHGQAFGYAQGICGF